MKRKSIQLYARLALLLGLSLGLVVLASASTLAGPEANSKRRINSSASKEVVVPAGQFLMGCTYDLSNLKCDSDAIPVHAVYVDAFYIDQTEVTNAQYAACVASGVCPEPLSHESATRPDYYTNPAYANYPVIQVDWGRANAYCAWVGRRLPTEAEWEKAARGTDLRSYPWGNDLSCERANVTLADRTCVGDTVPVGSYPANASPYGALDMGGNVREWVNDLYDSRYYGHTPYYNPQGPTYTDKGEHLVRGGSWGDDQNNNTTWVRIDEKGIYAVLQIGFRCARSAGPGGTPTPTPLPTPTPTPLPAPASKTIGSEGGLVWQAYQRHLTLLNVPPGAVTDPTTITLSYDQRSTRQQELEGLDHFFSIGITGSMPISSFQAPVQVILGYPGYGPIISGSLGFYRWDAASWVTEGITLTQLSSEDVLAQIDRAGAYGLLGSTNRFYLPLVLRGE